MSLAYGGVAPLKAAARRLRPSLTDRRFWLLWLKEPTFGSLRRGSHPLLPCSTGEIWNKLQGDGKGGSVGCGEEAERAGSLEKRRQAASDHHGHGQQQQGQRGRHQGWSRVRLSLVVVYLPCCVPWRTSAVVDVFLSLQRSIPIQAEVDLKLAREPVSRPFFGLYCFGLCSLSLWHLYAMLPLVRISSKKQRWDVEYGRLLL